MRRKAARVAGAFLILAGVVRLTVKDDVPILATLFYATPPAVLAAGALAWAVLRGGRPALLGLPAAALLGGWQGAVSSFDRTPSAGEQRVVFWNVQNGKAGWDRLGGELAGESADLLAVVEAGQGARKLPPHLPGYAWAWPGSGIAVAVRGRVLSSELRPLGPKSDAAVVRVELGGRALTLIVADLVSNPLRSRREPFRRLERLMREVGPDLVLGDFNTPRDSVFFEGWRPRFRHAFEAAGKGWDATWPRPLPVLTIDQVWCGPRLEPRSAEHVGSGASDHRRVRVSVSAVGG